MALNERLPPLPGSARLPDNGARAVDRPPREDILVVEDLAVRFADAPVNIIDGVSFSVGSGRTLAIVGESGCGKSLTALALLGLLPPKAGLPRGRAMFGGRDLLKLGDRDLADIRGDRLAMIFQEPMTSLNPAFTIGDQIIETIIRHRGTSAAAAEARAIEMLDLVRIPAPKERMRSYPHQLSGGMRQRAMIAMALANDPQLLIADEPTTALDVTIQAQILSLIARLQEDTGTAVILITHDLGVVAEVSDEVLVMYAGLVAEAGPVEAIFDDPQHPYTIGLMGSMPSLGQRGARLATIPGVVPLPEQMPVGCRFSTRCPFAEEYCRTHRPPLAEISPGHRVACFKAPLERSQGAVA
jgi:peptide/nickel transport system ATP-binding protein